MANKELKSIKFPGLADTYTVNSMPDDASANQQLATDKDGVVKWEEKPFYSTGPLFVKCLSFDVPIILYKVSSEVPDVGNLTVGSHVHLWEFYSGEEYDENVFMIANGIYVVGDMACAYVTEDNSSIDMGDGIIYNFPERGVYFGTIENEIKVIGASLTNVNEPEISWDGITEKIKAIDSKYLPEIPAEKLPSSFFSMVQKTFEGSFDKVTEGRDTFRFNNQDYYKISEFSPSREDVISFSGTREN